MDRHGHFIAQLHRRGADQNPFAGQPARVEPTEKDVDKGHPGDRLGPDPEIDKELLRRPMAALGQNRE